jgi:peptidoglycan/LPS O-acetylase OafA/YrhL
LLLNIVEPSPGQSVYSVLFFFAGMLFKLLNIKINLKYFYISFLFSVYSIFFKKIPEAVEIICTAYTILFLGYKLNFFRRFFNEIGDYSYGIYVYAFPIQQFVYFVMYHYYGIAISPSYLMLLSGIFLFPIAVISWHFIESYFLGLKNSILSSKKATLL